MAKIGYLYMAEDETTYADSREWMDDYGCVRILVDEPDQEKLRPQWKQLMDVLERGDELVLAKFSNAVRSTQGLSNLIELCRVKVVRIISILDKVDSKGVLFPGTSINDVLSMVGSIPEEVVALRQHKDHVERLKKMAMARPNIIHSKSDRERNIVNMYHQNYSIDDIWKASGYASRTSIFRVLNRYGVTLNRGKFAGPMGPRKKKNV